jgi:hypothetical protein
MLFAPLFTLAFKLAPLPILPVFLHGLVYCAGDAANDTQEEEDDQ